MKFMSKCLITTAMIACTVSAQAAPVKVLKYAHFQSADLSSPKQAAALAFESCVEGKTSGSIDVQGLSCKPVGHWSEVLEGLQLGAIQMTAIHDGPISAFYKPFSVLALPYVFDDQAMAWEIMDGDFGKPCLRICVRRQASEVLVLPITAYVTSPIMFVRLLNLRI